MGISIVFVSIGFLVMLCSIQGSESLILRKSDLKFACKAYKESGGKLEQTKIRIEQHLRAQKIEESKIKKFSAKIAELIKRLVDGFFLSVKGQNFLIPQQPQNTYEDDPVDKPTHEQPDFHYEEEDEPNSEEPTTTDEPTPDQSASDETPLDASLTKDPPLDELPSDEVPSDQLSSDQSPSNDISSDDVLSDELASTELTTDQSSQEKPTHGKPISNKPPKEQPESHQGLHPLKPVMDSIKNFLFSSRNICEILQFPLLLNINDTPQRLIAQILDQPRIRLD